MKTLLSSNKTNSTVKRILFFVAVIFAFMATVQTAYSQNGVYISPVTGTADPSAMLDVYCLNKGLLIPRVPLNGINDNVTVPNPATSLLVYCDGSMALSAGYYYNSGTPLAPVWVPFGNVVSVTASGNITSSGGQNPIITFTGVLPVGNGGTGSAIQNFVDLTTNQTIGGTKTFSSPIAGSITGNAGTVTNGFYTTSFLAGDVTGIPGANAVAKIQGTPVLSTTPTANQLLQFNSTNSKWEPTTLTGTYGISITGNAATVTNGVYTSGSYADPSWLTSLAGSKITGTVANATNAATSVNFSGSLAGDVTGTQGATTVARIRGVNITTSAPTNGQFLKYNSTTTQWEPAADNNSGGTVTQINTGSGLTGGPVTTTGTIALANGTASGQVFVTGATPFTPALQTMSGDATIGITGVLTLASVATAGTNTKISYNAKGLVTSGTAALLASADFSNQGTTTTVLHGNASGNPGWSAVNLGTDVTGSLPGASVSGNISGNAANVTGVVAIANGGTGATTASGARTNLGTAASGANSDITSLLGLTTPLSISSGGTGTATTSQNFVFAGPASGSGAPSFRLLTSGDLPPSSGNYIQNLGGPSSPQTAGFNINGSGYIGDGTRYMQLINTSAQAIYTTNDFYLRPTGGLILQPGYSVANTGNIQIKDGAGTQYGVFNGNVKRFGLIDEGNPTPYIPGSRLSVQGNVSIGTLGTYATVAAPTNGMIVEGNVGIGTAGPTSKLHVYGGYIIDEQTAGVQTYVGSTASAGYVQTNGTYPLAFYSGGNQAVTILNSGYVGIGTTSPATLLHVRSAASTDAETRIDVTSGSNKSIIGLANAGTDYGQLYFDNATNNLVLYQKYASGNLLFGTNSATNMTIQSGGNVGIGTSNPVDNGGNATRLQIMSNSPVLKTGVCIVGPLEVGDNGSETSLLSSGYSRMSNSHSISGSFPFNFNGNLILQSRTTGSGYGIAFVPGTGVIAMSVGANGGSNIGIGTGSSTANYPLDVVGDINSSTGYSIAGTATSGNYLRGNGSQFVSSAIQASDITAALGTGSTNYAAKWTGTNSLSYGVIYDNGNVGIGNSGPGAKLDVTGPATGSGITIKAGGGGDVVLASGGSLFFDNNYSYNTGNYIKPVASNTQAFYTSGAERMRITSGGNVGIGATSPNALLNVAGTIIPTQGVQQQIASINLNMTSPFGSNDLGPVLGLNVTGVQRYTRNSGSEIRSTGGINDAYGRNITYQTDVGLAYPLGAAQAWLYGLNSAATITSLVSGWQNVIIGAGGSVSAPSAISIGNNSTLLDSICGVKAQIAGTYNANNSYYQLAALYAVDRASGSATHWAGYFKGNVYSSGTVTIGPTASGPILDIQATNSGPWALRFYRSDLSGGPQLYASDASTLYESGNFTSSNNLTATGDIYCNSWYRGGTSDNNFTKFYGNTRQMVFRTDGTAQYSSNGGYPFVWEYGGDGSSPDYRKMILNTDGTIWTPAYGWLGNYFAPISGSGNYIQNGTSAQSANFNITGTGTFSNPGSSTPLLQLSSVTMSSVAGSDLVLRNLGQLRFTDGNVWDWNTWGGIKFVQSQNKMVIGGPASSYFTANTSPPSISVVFDGVSAVGIGTGTTTPASQMVLYGNAGTGTPVAGAGTLLLADPGDLVGNGGSVLFGGNAQLYFAGIKGYITDGGTNTAGDLALYTRNVSTDASLTERMRILSNGNVGIGTNSPLDNKSQPCRVKVISGSSYVTGASINGPIEISNNGSETFSSNSGYGTARIWCPTSTLGTFPFNLNGNLVIEPRTTSNSYGIAFVTGTGSTVSMSINASGSGYVLVANLAGTGNRAVYSDASGNLTNSSSDERLKKNIETISAKIDVIKTLNELRGVYYNWNTDIDAAKNLGDQKEIGMIAQEVEKVLPELVGANSTGYKSLDYAKIAGFLIEVNKVQQGMIDSLKLANKDFKSSIINLQTENENLKAQNKSFNNKFESQQAKIESQEAEINKIKQKLGLDDKAEK